MGEGVVVHVLPQVTAAASGTLTDPFSAVPFPYPGIGIYEYWLLAETLETSLCPGSGVAEL